MIEVFKILHHNVDSSVAPEFIRNRLHLLGLLEATNTSF